MKTFCNKRPPLNRRMVAKTRHRLILRFNVVIDEHALPGIPIGTQEGPAQDGRKQGRSTAGAVGGIRGRGDLLPTALIGSGMAWLYWTDRSDRRLGRLAESQIVPSSARQAWLAL
ncbi:hypothetical protein K227x_08280 [Rubripirellula lacrimiformis]|uniref:Uncharacterized protein n=2 Tax=Rubripirellula lacrimiformis TaxID=1930273 RepID=A0A517N5S1_9BACT|nr:hypothetical protein K227x_08280 [Rubripirellula lacrimiformis]